MLGILELRHQRNDLLPQYRRRMRNRVDIQLQQQLRLRTKVMNEARPAHPFLVAAIVGILGGGALILTTMLTRRGQMVFLPYGALIVAVALYLRSRRILSFGSRFGASLLAFMLASIVLEYYLIAYVNPSVLSAWFRHIVLPFGAFLLIGSVTSAIVAKASLWGARAG